MQLLRYVYAGKNYLNQLISSLTFPHSPLVGRGMVTQNLPVWKVVGRV